jgi:alpha-1,3-glucosyltransferase
MRIPLKVHWTILHFLVSIYSLTRSAWFEFLLSKLASLVDPEMLKINHLFYSSYETILFQRLTVLFISDLFYYLSLRLYFKKEKNSSFFLFCYFLPSLIIIDSIPISIYNPI